METCKACQGKRIEGCPTCLASGYLLCIDCRGTGRERRDKIGYMWQDDCYTCHGTGRSDEVCYTCQGSRIMPCHVCNGKGEV